jgi:hypothetical protein
MTKLFNAFLLILAGATEQELVRQVKYLKAENQILWGKRSDRIKLSSADRTRPVKHGFRRSVLCQLWAGSVMVESREPGLPGAAG